MSDKIISIREDGVAVAVWSGDDSQEAVNQFALFFKSELYKAVPNRGVDAYVAVADPYKRWDHVLHGGYTDEDGNDHILVVGFGISDDEWSSFVPQDIKESQIGVERATLQ